MLSESLHVRCSRATALPAYRLGGRSVVVSRASACQAASMAVDQTLNPLVAAVKPSKTMALSDAATAMKEAGVDVRIRSVAHPFGHRRLACTWNSHSMCQGSLLNPSSQL